MNLLVQSPTQACCANIANLYLPLWLWNSGQTSIKRCPSIKTEVLKKLPGTNSEDVFQTNASQTVRYWCPTYPPHFPFLIHSLQLFYVINPNRQVLQSGGSHPGAHASVISRQSFPALEFSCHPVYCEKGTPPNKGGGSSFIVTKLPSFLEPKG